MEARIPHRARDAVVGEEQRDVLRDPGRGDGLERDAEAAEPLLARRMALPVGVDEDLGTAAQRLSDEARVTSDIFVKPPTRALD